MVVNVGYVDITQNKNALKMNVNVVQIFTLDLDQNKLDKLSFQKFNLVRYFMNHIVLKVSKSEPYFVP
jgi:hypothetical protein